MATITMLNSPSTIVNLLSDGICFTFKMQGVESGTTLSKFGYQLLDGSGDPITALEVISAVESEEFAICFHRDVRDLVSMDPKNARCTSWRDLTEAVSSFRLRYWSSDFNKASCATTLSSVTETQDYTIINSTEQYYDTLDLAPTWVLFTKYPKVSGFCKNQCQIFSLWSTGSTVRIEAEPFGLYKEFTVSNARQLFLHPWSIAEYFHNNPVITACGNSSVQEVYDCLSGIRVYINDKLVSTFKFEECDCDTVRVLYQMPQGGFSWITFQTQQTQISTKYKTSCAFPVVAYPGTENYNRKPYSRRSLETSGGSPTTLSIEKEIVLLREIDYGDDQQIYIEEFFASTRYFIEFRKRDGGVGLVRFNVAQIKTISKGGSEYLQIKAILQTELNLPL